MNVVLAGLLFAESGRTPAHAQTLARLEGSNVAWELDARSARIDTHLGRQALFLRANAPPAFAAATDLSDGTIEFEIAPLTGGNFVGLVFRYASATLHENIYFRLHRSGSFEAVQYAPRLHTAAGIWQLLPEFMATAIYQPGAWTRVRVEISGGRLQVLIGDTAMLALDVKRMKGVTATGRVGFWGRVNNRPEEWTAAISNIRITPRTSRGVTTSPDTSDMPPGTLTGWSAVGPVIATDSLEPPALPSTAEWKPLPIEEGGLVNISRHYAKPPGGRHVVFLRNTVRSLVDTVAALDIGYSDDITLWLNGRRLYRGSNAFNERYPGALGLMYPAAERVYLPLRPGANDLVIAVGERAFGWGLKARVTRP